VKLRKVFAEAIDKSLVLFLQIRACIDERLFRIVQSSGSSVRFIVIHFHHSTFFHGLDHHLNPWPHPHSLTQHFRIEPTSIWILFLGNALMSLSRNHGHSVHRSSNNS